MPLVPIAKQLFQRRRRRKRTGREDPDESQRPRKSPRSIGASFVFDDASLGFLDNETGLPLADEKPVRSSILRLLEERRSGKWSQKPRAWQSKALGSFTKRPPNKDDCRRDWRPLAKRRIPFVHLGTPPSDAVLALDRSGSYVLSLGSRDNKNNVPLALALRFFGVPSPSALQEKGKKKESSSAGICTTPLLQTTPLLYEILDESPEETVFSFRRSISPATTPVKLLISNDWKVGVAIFQPSTVWTEDGPVGNLVLFSLPTSIARHNTQTIFQCSNVRLGAHASSHTPRNLLWRVDQIPQKLDADDSSNSIFDSVLHLPGYLFFNDEEDGFRLTWVTDTWNSDEFVCRQKMTDSLFLKGATAAVLTAQKTWEDIVCDTLTGKRVILQKDAKQHGLKIASESFLQVDTLLAEILSGRKGISEVHPDFHYNLISVHSNGRVADLIIAFVRKQKPGSLGIFVQVDLFTGHYREEDWVKSLRTKDSASLRSWCSTLALNRRMRQKRSGPYSVHKKHTIDWSRLCIESPFDPDEADDYDPEFWRDYVSSAEAVLSSAAPKFVSLSSLYPDCDLVTNKAIISCLPVAALRGKKSPTELVYS